MEAAEEFINSWTFEEFTQDRKTQFAVVRVWRSLVKQQRMFHLKSVRNIPLFLGKIWQGYGTN
jgi:hypothetical protein